MTTPPSTDMAAPEEAGVVGASAAMVPAMPRQTVDPNNPEPDFYEEANEQARAEAAAAELEPMSITEIADWFGVPATTVRRQWIYERDAIRDPQRRFPLATWPGSNPRWAWRVVKAWGVYTERLNADGTVHPKLPPTIS